MMNAVRIFNVPLLAACSGAAALGFEHGNLVVAVGNAVAVTMLSLGLIARLVLTSKSE